MAGSAAVTDRERAGGRRRGRVRRWAKRFFVGAAVAIASLLAAGAIYQFAATKIAERKYARPGVLVDVGGYRLHLYCTGEGSPAVVLDAGLGAGLLDWGTVQPAVGGFTRVCSYDHAGAGWSDDGPRPRASAQIVSELHELLSRAGVAPPYVLVGHSLGGMHAQLYASRYPAEVAGVVLVDSSHPDQTLRPELKDPPPSVALLFKALAPFGVPRLLFKLLPSPSSNVPPELLAERAALYTSTRHLYYVADEFAALPLSHAQLRAAPMQLGDRPLVVLSHGRAQAIPFESPEQTAAAERAWQELQADLATRSRNSRRIVAERSGHFIQFDQPDLVIDAVRQIVEAARH